ncbi:MAG: hypothetical protein R2744_07155 [Bacteroidales bacterium]
MEISQNDWYASFMIPLLQKKSMECYFAQEKPEYRDHKENNLYKLGKYISILSLKRQVMTPTR